MKTSFVVQRTTEIGIRVLILDRISEKQTCHVKIVRFSVMSPFGEQAQRRCTFQFYGLFRDL